jgi:tRNA(adenine34) deaminase
MRMGSSLSAGLRSDRVIVFDFKSLDLQARPVPPNAGEAGTVTKARSTDKSLSFMEAALEQARLAAAQGEVPVGALVVRERKIIAQAHNRTIELNDPTAQAEILVIRQAAAALESQRLERCDLYVSLEPCAMCAAAISFARIRRLYFAASDEKGGAVEHGVRFFDHPTCHHRPQIYGGIDEARAVDLLKAFFKARR